MAEAWTPGEGRRGIAWWKLATGPWMTLVILGAFLYAGPAEQFQMPEAARIIFFHVPVALLLALWYLIAAVFGWRYLRSADLLDDRRAATAAEVGLLCTVLATLSGSVFARVQWGTWWNWDPKMIAIVVVLFLYFAYFALRAEVDDEERRARLSAVYAIIGGIAVPFLIYSIPQLPVFDSLHPEGVLQPGGMSPDYRIVWLGALLGFGAITCWVYDLRLRVAAAWERFAGL